MSPPKMKSPEPLTEPLVIDGFAVVLVPALATDESAQPVPVDVDTPETSAMPRVGQFAVPVLNVGVSVKVYVPPAALQTYSTPPASYMLAELLYACVVPPEGASHTFDPLVSVIPRE